MFTDQERRIFSYRAKNRQVFGDPVALWRRMTAILGGYAHLVEVMNLARSDTPMALEAAIELGHAVCHAFNLGEMFNPDTGEGVLEDEWCQVLKEFREWQEKNVLTAETSATSSEATATSSAGQLPTTNTAA